MTLECRSSFTLICKSHLRSDSTKTAFQPASVVPYSAPAKNKEISVLYMKIIYVCTYVYKGYKLIVCCMTA